MGGRINFVQAELESFLNSQAPNESYDYAVFVHCIWYLSTPTILGKMLAALRTRAKKVIIAEYSLDIQGDLAALPHLLAALSQAELNSRKQALSLKEQGNISSLATPRIIRDLAASTGWQLQHENIVPHSDALQDGKWEVGFVLSDDYQKQVKTESDERYRLLAEAMIDVVRTSTNALGPQARPKTMPTWVSLWA